MYFRHRPAAHQVVPRQVTPRKHSPKLSPILKQSGGTTRRSGQKRNKKNTHNTNKNSKK